MLPVIGEAACVRADLTGVWRVYATTPEVTRCTVILPATGTAISTNSSCYIPNYGNYVLRGNLTLDTTSCRLYGSINIYGLSKYFEGWISRGKDSMSGMAWTPNDPLDGGVVSGTKQ